MSEALILASSSPRRRALLAQIGLVPRILSPCVDETPRPGEAPAALVARLAGAKATAVAQRAEARGLAVLAADTAVVLDGRALGKPADFAEACAMLEALSGRWHEVLTGIAVVAPGEEATCAVTVRTRVCFRALEPGEIAAYCALPEPYDKAGGYGIQGVAAIFVAAIEGSYSNVVGLPLRETEAMLRRAGVDTWAMRSQR